MNRNDLLPVLATAIDQWDTDIQHVTHLVADAVRDGKVTRDDILGFDAKDPQAPVRFAALCGFAVCGLPRVPGVIEQGDLVVAVFTAGEIADGTLDLYLYDEDDLPAGVTPESAAEALRAVGDAHGGFLLLAEAFDALTAHCG